jgi:uncharacterized protein (TIGR00369 family)
MNTDINALLKLLLEEFSQNPFHRLLGLKPDCYDIENRCIRFDMREELVGNPDFGILHGGVIATILDIEGGFILSLDGAWQRKRLEPLEKAKGGTINLHVDYLRPGKGEKFVASGTILHHGNEIAVVHTELRNELGELIAVGSGTYKVG